MKTEREIAVNSLAFIENRIHEINRLFADNESNDIRLDATYKSGAVLEAKEKMKQVIKMISWIKNHYSIANQTAYTDQEMTDFGIIE